MKTPKALLIASTLMLAALPALLVGCKTAGYDTGNKTAANIQTAADQIGALPAQIDKTLASLNELSEKPQADLRPQFKAYSANRSDLESAAKDIGSTHKSMVENGKAFFAQWDEQVAKIQSEDIKSRSQSRKDEVMKKLEALKAKYAEAESAFKPFMSDLKDIEQALSMDLTASGVKAVSKSAAKANKSAVPLKKSIGELSDGFKALGLAMSSVTPQQPAK